MNIYISSSWKNREIVRELAQGLRTKGENVFDFTNPQDRKCEPIPPERYLEQFDPDKHNYFEYLNKPEWGDAVRENRKKLTQSDVVILLLPCGIDATADWAFAVGKGKYTIIIGHPLKGERSPVHLWADWFVKDVDEFWKLYKD